MPRSTGDKSQAKNAQTYFRRTVRDEATASQIGKDERAAEAAKMANLRRLRLEKEAADKLAAENAAPPVKPAKPERQRPPARKPPTMMKITY